MSDSIKKIYLGLASKVLWVERKFRVNELSHQPGGFDIIIEYHSGNVFGYDWIKRPGDYTGKILENEAREDDMDYDYQDERTVLAASQKFIRSAYCKYYDDKEEYKIAPFEKVWDSKTGGNSVVEAMRDFENDISKKFIYKKYPDSETPYYDIALAYEKEYYGYKKLEYYKKALEFYRHRVKLGFGTSELLNRIRSIEKRVDELDGELPF